jgi:hypothetical protein
MSARSTTPATPGQQYGVAARQSWRKRVRRAAGGWVAVGAKAYQAIYRRLCVFWNRITAMPHVDPAG